MHIYICTFKKCRL